MGVAHIGREPGTGDLLVRAPFDAKDVLKVMGGRWRPAPTKAWAFGPQMLGQVRRVLEEEFGLTVIVDAPRASTTGQGRKTTGATWATQMFSGLPEHLREPVYRALVRVLHPDVGGDTAAAQQLLAAYQPRKSA